MPRIEASGSVVPDTAVSTETLSLGPLPDAVDLFGFNLDRQQLFVVIVVVFVFMGSNGLIAFLLSFAAYTLFGRLTAQMSSSSGSSRSSNSSVRVPRISGLGSVGRGGGSTGGGGGSGAGTGNKGENKRGGANIRGMADLPCDPVVG